MSPIDQSAKAAKGASRDESAPAGAQVGGAAGMAARLAAIGLLRGALARRGGLDESLNTPVWRKLPPVDRGFARALAMATLRNLGRIDRTLQSKLKRRPPDAVFDLLRIGVAQLTALDVPDFAAVATTVKLAERTGDTRPYKGLINAVLRGVIRDGGLCAPIEAALPDWLAQRWLATYGQAAVSGLAAAAADEPPTDLSLKRADELERWLEPLAAASLPAGQGLRTRMKGDVSDWPGFAEGAWWVQDAAAAIPVRLLAPQTHETVVDLCAAPGGKTLQIAATGAQTVALDRSEVRLKRLQANLERTGLRAEVVVAAAEAWDDPRQFDAVLLDAPCSATGTFRRNPDVLWGARPGDIGKLADVQHRLLDVAAERVKPGGRLVYCVCSLEREEGETQILAFLRRNPAFRTDRAQPEALGAPAESLTPEGWLRILPGSWVETGGLDGFFAARLTRI